MIRLAMLYDVGDTDAGISVQSAMWIIHRGVQMVIILKERLKANQGHLPKYPGYQSVMKKLSE